MSSQPGSGHRARPGAHPPRAPGPLSRLGLSPRPAAVCEAARPPPARGNISGRVPAPPRGSGERGRPGRAPSRRVPGGGRG